MCGGGVCVGGCALYFRDSFAHTQRLFTKILGGTGNALALELVLALALAPLELDWN